MRYPARMRGAPKPSGALPIARAPIALRSEPGPGRRIASCFMPHATIGKLGYAANAATVLESAG